MNRKITIFISYHKPSRLIKNKIFTPIHLGRASNQLHKDGVSICDDSSWLVKNMIGDDTGDNISNLNRFLCEFTGMYWAWKNYEYIGDPDYIGFCTYRRCFDFSGKTDKSKIEYGMIYRDIIPDDIEDCFGYKEENIDKIINGFDIVHGVKVNYYCSVKEQFKELEDQEFGLDANIFYKILDYLKETSIYKKAVEEYECSKEQFWYNCFIMKKEIFFEYCEFIFPILFKFHKEIEYNRYNINGQRMIAYIGERLTGVFLTQKINDGVKTLAVPINMLNEKFLTPIKINTADENTIPIVLSVNDNYIPILSVCILSIIDNSNKNRCYEINILETDISERNKIKIKNLERENLKINFINIIPLVEKNIKSINKLHWHFSPETYYRIFIPKIFSNYKKVIYLDCDTIILDDIAKIFDCNIDDYCIAGVEDFEVKRIIFYKKNSLHDKIIHYFKDDLKIGDGNNYFQAGVLVLNIKKLQEIDFENKCISLLEKIDPIFVDQDILNSILKNKVLILPDEWNVEWHVRFEYNLSRQLPIDYYSRFINACRNPKIIHYTSHIKPWDWPQDPWCSYFWHYARQSDYYEEIIFRRCEKIQAAVLKNININNRVKIIIKKILKKVLPEHVIYYLKNVKKKYLD